MDTRRVDGLTRSEPPGREKGVVWRGWSLESWDGQGGAGEGAGSQFPLAHWVQEGAGHVG